MYDEAQDRYKEALPLYKGVGDVLGEANCLKRFGDIALERMEYDVARSFCEEALPLYQSVGSVLGKANSVQTLGDIALKSNQAAAKLLFAEALTLYSQIQEPLSLGE